MNMFLVEDFVEKHEAFLEVHDRVRHAGSILASMYRAQKVAKYPHNKHLWEFGDYSLTAEHFSFELSKLVAVGMPLPTS